MEIAFPVINIVPSRKAQGIVGANQRRSTALAQELWPRRRHPLQESRQVKLARHVDM
jgi:hypothetical protein